MINKILRSNKLTQFKRIVFGIPFYFLDVLQIITSIFKNLIFKNKLYDKDFVIITGADEKFSKTLFQLLNNLRNYSFINKIIIYDLGFHPNTINKINSDFKEIEIKKFNFLDYPDFFSEKNNNGILGGYAWKPQLIYEEFFRLKKKIIWLDSANLINLKFLLVLIILTDKGFFSPISTGRVYDFTHPKVLKSLSNILPLQNERNLTGGFICFDWENNDVKKLITEWARLSKIKDNILPEESKEFLHRHDQSLLTLLYENILKKGYMPKNKRVFGIKVNQNPNQVIFLYTNNSRTKNKEIFDFWYNNYKTISTKTIKYAKIIWILEVESLRKIPKKYLNRNIVICSINNESDIENEIFSKYKQYVDILFLNNIKTITKDKFHTKKTFKFDENENVKDFYIKILEISKNI